LKAKHFSKTNRDKNDEGQANQKGGQFKLFIFLKKNLRRRRRRSLIP